MELHLDEVDKQIIYYLMKDARNVSAPTIAEEVDVTPGTIRNRIHKLEKQGVIRGFHAHIDFSNVEGRLTNLFRGSTKNNTDSLIEKALQVSGVVNIREVMSGEANLHIKAVGENTAELTRISHQLSDLGINITGQELINQELFHPFHAFASQGNQTASIVKFRRLGGGAETIDFAVSPDAPVTDKTLANINQEGLIDDNVLVVAIERDGEILTPHGETIVKEGDIATVFSPEGISEETVQAFTSSVDTNS